MKDMEMYLVGGIVRDMLLGLKPKDYDFTVVLPPDTMASFHYMRWMLEQRGVEIFVETPEFLTIRGRFSKDDAEYPGIAGDFVLARKDSETSDGRRPDSVEPGTLLDDLARRDFTVNAMAMKDGKIIDPFEGEYDLDQRILRFVGDPMTRIREDARRVMRAYRFVVTKGFTLDYSALEAIRSREVPGQLAKISEERRADELSKMFRFDTLKSLDVLTGLPEDLRKAMFAGRVRLDSTLKQ
jgi:tRNA nucleotidyltransferase/poly(A) polymerase